MITRLKRLLKREKPRVFLGRLSIAPHAQTLQRPDAELGAALLARLEEIIDLPPADQASNPAPTDLVLDLVVPRFLVGDYWDVSLGATSLPLFWRPRVTLSGHLYALQSRETKYTCSVTQKMPWGEFFRRQLSWRNAFRFRSVFAAEDLNHLLSLACHGLIHRLRKSL